MPRIIALISIFLVSHFCFSQTWKGVVKDEKGEALPFVNIFFDGTTNGTTSNMEGEFTIVQKNPANTSLAFQFVGYEKFNYSLIGKSPDKRLTITLSTQKVVLREAVVLASKKDPAYYYIKQAQKKRKYYRKQITEFGCDIYMKGVTQLAEIPEKMPFFVPDDEGIDSSLLGILYLSESLGTVTYSDEEGLKEEMIASKVSGDPQAFSWNRAEQVFVDFYEERVLMAGLNERGFVSPIAGDALLYYDYKWQGSFEEEGRTIHKIKLIPKRKTDLAFSGDIYLYDSFWAIQGLDILVSKDAQIEFMDSISLKQNTTHVKEDVFLPLSIQQTYYFGVFGFKADYKAVANMSNYKLENIENKAFKKNQVFQVKDDALKTDSTFWDKNRPIVLDSLEARNYQKGDSLLKIIHSKPYLDSLDSLSNRFKIGKLLLTGFNFYNSYDSTSFTLPSALSLIQFNAVDGWLLDLKSTFHKQHEHGSRDFMVRGRYGFQSEIPGLELKLTQRLNETNQAFTLFHAGWINRQINNAEPIDEFINTSYALFGNEDYMNLYNALFGKVGGGLEVTNGLKLRAYASVEQRFSLSNHWNNYSWSRNSKTFDTNLPVNNAPYNRSNFSESTGLAKFEFQADIIFKQKYALYPNKKVNYGSKLPKVRLNYSLNQQLITKKGTFHKVESTVYDKVRMGIIGSGSYRVTAGKFLGNTRNIDLVDYNHFMGNQTFLLQLKPDGFQNLEYYKYSTKDSYLEAHYTHHFYGFFLNKIPLVKKLKFKEVVGINYLQSFGNNSTSYTEAFVGIENIFTVIRLDVVSTLQDGKLQSPVLRLGVRIN